MILARPGTFKAIVGQEVEGDDSLGFLVSVPVLLNVKKGLIVTEIHDSVRQRLRTEVRTAERLRVVPVGGESRRARSWFLPCGNSASGTRRWPVLDCIPDFGQPDEEQERVRRLREAENRQQRERLRGARTRCPV